MLFIFHFLRILDQELLIVLPLFLTHGDGQSLFNFVGIGLSNLVLFGFFCCFVSFLFPAGL